MRRYLAQLSLIIIMLTGTAGHVNAQDDQAAAAYRQGDYTTAIRLYENQLDQSRISGELLYNLGAAHYQTGNLGDAMRYLQQATHYMPRDPQLQRDLAQLRAERTNLIGEETDTLIMLANASAEVLTLYELALLVFGVWVLFFVALGWQLFSPSAFTEWLAWGLAGLVCIGILSIGSRLYIQSQRPQAVVMSASVAVKSGAGDDYLTLYTLFEAADMRVIDQREDWIRFALADGRQGWIPADRIAYVLPE